MPLEIEKLLHLYKGGGRPPLNELVNGELLRIFQCGVVKKELASFGLLLPAPDKSECCRERWFEGKFINVSTNWREHCKELRDWKNKDGRNVYDEICEHCDREHAYIAETQNEPIIYLCHGGMVDCALPIVVDGHTVAMLFAGQKCPIEGGFWSDDFIKNYATQNNISGSFDAKKESIKRNRKIMDEMAKREPDRNVPNLIALADKALNIWPTDIPEILKEIKDTAGQLSQLAEKTIGYQLNIIRGYFTSKVAKLLPESDDKFWTGFSEFLLELANFYNRDYALFYMLKRATDDSMKAVCTIPEAIIRSRLLAIERKRFFPLKNADLSCEPILLKPSEAKDRLFSDSYFFDSLCYVIPLEVNGPLGILVMGNFGRKGGYKLVERELRFIKEQFQDVSIILENRRQLLARDAYVTDLSHEIKSPVAAVSFAARNILAGRVDLNQVKPTLEEVLRRLKLLKMNIDRFSMLERLLSTPESLKPAAVPVYDVAKECQSEYQDLIGKKGIKIQVNPELKDLPMVFTNREAFKHALGNMIHNAVKYGDPDTEVIVEGRKVRTEIRTEIRIDVRDVGIPIYPEEVKLLGQRNFRANEAIKRDPSGTGIGFTIIDRFLKIAKGRFEVQSIPRNDQRHHVIISMFLPQ